MSTAVAALSVLSQVFENNRMVISDYGLSAVKSIRDKGSASEAGCFFGKKRSTRNVPPPAGSGSEEVVRGRGQKEEDPWVAPEVFAGGEHTQQSDLYSYGGILFEVSFGGVFVLNTNSFFSLSPAL